MLTVCPCPGNSWPLEDWLLLVGLIAAGVLIFIAGAQMLGRWVKPEPSDSTTGSGGGER